MMKRKYQNKYRIDSTRLQNWDYRSNAMYFITICTKNRNHFFGEISDGKIKLSKIGIIANKYWLEIPNHFPFVKLDAFVVMPNHIHGIIIIDKPNSNDSDAQNIVETQNIKETQNIASLRNKFGPQSKNLASIMRGYKIGVTKDAKTNDPNWAWQPLYYDHIIRNNKSFKRIKKYIFENPQKWKEDKFYL